MRYLKVELLNGCKTIEELELYFGRDVIFKCREYSQIKSLLINNNEASSFVKIYYFDNYYVAMWNERNFLNDSVA